MNYYEHESSYIDDNVVIEGEKLGYGVLPCQVKL